MQTILLLEDGKTFIGESFGAKVTAVAEVVFNTGMTGYQEIITDPSYHGQMVTMTYPQIGNTGINAEDGESLKPCVEALIVKELSPVSSNHRANETLDAYLKRNFIPGIQQIDTRALTRHIREKGSMMGILSNEGLAISELKKRLADHPGIVGRDLVKDVTCGKIRQWGQKAGQNWYYDKLQISGRRAVRITAYDFGIKHNILRLMSALGMDVTVVPASTSAEKAMELNPDGIFLSNGPGDPEAVVYAIEAVKRLAQSKPIFGICLGHQILGLAFGAKTFKLKFGHHGSNHPVKNLKTGEIEITAQNHNFAVEADSAEKAGFEITHLNLNDRTVEGMRHRDLPVFSVQYHPEAAPGPHDSLYLFGEFIKQIQ